MLFLKKIKNFWCCHKNIVVLWQNKEEWHHPVASYHSTSPASYQGERQAACQGRTGAHR